MKDQTELESQVQGWLEEIKQVPSRNPHAAARGRAQFLGQAVSASEFSRHKGWKSIFRKERLAMNMIVSILVVAGLLFGGGATVNAAQNDLPDGPLYALKTWSEDLSLQFKNDPEQKVDRLLDLAQVRMQEMTRLTDAGKNVPDQVRKRLEQHLQQALQICASLDDPAMNQTLLHIRESLQQQDREMQRLQLHATRDSQPVLEQTRTMLQQRMQLVEEGMLNHELFRDAVRNGFHFGQGETVTPPAQNGKGSPSGLPTSVPAGQNTNPGGPNPDPTGASYGPGEPNPDPGGPNPDSGGTHNNQVGPNPNDNDGSNHQNGSPNTDKGGNGSGGDGGAGGGGSGGDSGGGGTGGGGSGGH